jgi:hypothetical protein
VAAASQTVALTPEDGSAEIGRWYYSQKSSFFMNQNDGALAALRAVGEEHGFEVTDVGVFYPWMQDLLLFDSRGRFVPQAAYPDFATGSAEEIFHGLTLGVYSEDGGLLRFPTTAAALLAPLAPAMQSTLIEGGALISGRRASGAPYAILERDALVRARAYVLRESGLEASDATLHTLLAKDLGVRSEDLVLIDSDRHLDLFMLAMPGERILVHDHREVIRTLKSLLESGQVPSSEISRVTSLLAAHERGMRGELYHQNEVYDTAAAQLRTAGFEVLRVAGDFSELGASVGESHINFMNSFHGTDPAGRHWMVSSPAAGLTSLETFWRQLITGLARHDLTSTSVYFVGAYTPGSGMDCTGAVAARIR